MVLPLGGGTTRISGEPREEKEGMTARGLEDGFINTLAPQPDETEKGWEGFFTKINQHKTGAVVRESKQSASEGSKLRH